MIPEIRKILCTTDLSRNALYAFAYAASLANCYGAGVTILHVLEDVSRSADNLVFNVLGEKKWQEIWKTNEQRVLSTIRTRIETFCEEVSEELPSCPFITDEIVVKIGNPVEEILSLSASGDFDMIVMGARGLGILGDALMGSTSRRVIRRSTKPVLVVRLPKERD